MPAKPRRPAPAPPAPGALRQVVPADQAPQLCTLLREVPTGPTWLSEVKFDGYRFLAWKTPAGVRLITRNGRDWADRLPTVVRWIEALSVDTAVLDGELVAVRPDGVTSFPDLDALSRAGAGTAARMGLVHTRRARIIRLLQFNLPIPPLWASG